MARGENIDESKHFREVFQSRDLVADILNYSAFSPSGVSLGDLVGREFQSRKYTGCIVQWNYQLIRFKLLSSPCSSDIV